MLQALAGQAWSDGAEIDVFAFEAGVKDWTNVAGAAKRSRLFHVLPLGRLGSHEHSPTREAFLAAIKQGAKFPVVMLVDSICPTCNGRKTYRGKAALRQNPDQEYNCWPCSGTGVLTEPKLYEVGW